MKHLRALWAALGVLLLIVGLPSIGSDIGAWAKWLRFLNKTVSHATLLILGVGIISGVCANLLSQAGKSWLEGRRARRSHTPGAAAEAGSDELAAPVPEAPVEKLPRPTSPQNAVWAAHTRRRRIANLVAARLALTREFRSALDNYIDTFLLRRRELDDSMDDARLRHVRDEYRTLQRLVAATYRRIGEHYRRFIDAEPDYDRRDELFDPPTPGLPLDYPLTQWWKPITFDEAVNQRVNADDAHLGRYLDRERAVLDAFEDWLAQEENHPLAMDAPGAHREDAEILAFVPKGQEEAPAPAQPQEAAPVAMLDARPGPISGGEQFDTYDFDVINTGRGAARIVQVWIANEAGERVSAAVDLHVVPLDNQWQRVRVEVQRVLSRAGGLHLSAKWSDNAGEHSKRLLDVTAALPAIPS